MTFTEETQRSRDMDKAIELGYAGRCECVSAFAEGAAYARRNLWQAFGDRLWQATRNDSALRRVLSEIAEGFRS